MSPRPLIELKNVAVRYKQRGSLFGKASFHEALKSINLTVNAGETIGVIGKNGAGKSTLLKILSGVIQPDKGAVNFYNASVSLLALQSGFDGNISGRNNALLTGLMQGFSKDDILQRMDSIKEYSELGDFFERPVRTYSTGMSARLGFSIATKISPDVLLVDEVLGVGDQKFRKKAELTMIEKISSQQTVVLVSHSEIQMKNLCDRAMLIHDGRSVISGSVEEVFAVYNDLEETE